MKLKKELLKKSHLYVIVDKNTLKNKNLVSITKKVLEKADIIQLRDKISDNSTILKEAEKLRLLTKEKDILFIINDKPEIAKAVSADGVHLGKEDLSIKKARKILGKDSIIGFSCHSLTDVFLAKKSGADYISIGPVFRTPLKPELINTLNLYSFRNLEERIKIPVFAVGGINYKNLKKVLSKGIKRVAICRGIFFSKNVSEETKKIKSILLNYNLP